MRFPYDTTDINELTNDYYLLMAKNDLTPPVRVNWAIIANLINHSFGAALITTLTGIDNAIEPNAYPVWLAANHPVIGVRGMSLLVMKKDNNNSIMQVAFASIEIEINNGGAITLDYEYRIFMRTVSVGSMGETGIWTPWKRVDAGALPQILLADNLTTTTAGEALDARQGYILKSQIDGMFKTGGIGNDWLNLTANPNIMFQKLLYIRNSHTNEILIRGEFMLKSGVTISPGASIINIDNFDTDINVNMIVGSIKIVNDLQSVQFLTTVPYGVQNGIDVVTNFELTTHISYAFDLKLIGNWAIPVE
ncbi:MAG: hypothetical protein FWD66_01125 [Paludibacter sp.]|nr:hypothetical protein [Paludibacter sp.]